MAGGIASATNRPKAKPDPSFRDYSRIRGIARRRTGCAKPCALRSGLWFLNRAMEERWRKEAKLAELLYWGATGIAGLMVAAVAVGYASNAADGEPFISMTALAVAGAIWLVGWAGRYLLRGC
jgi:hypothetical protein